jgi:hypothetical protein
VIDNATVHFRLFQMPCCHFRLMWVETQPVMFCPACGAAVPTGRPLETIIADPAATLTYEEGMWKAT